MKVGLNVLLWTAGFKEENFPLLDKVRDWGYDGVEFPMFTPDCSPWSKLRRKLDELRLGRTAVTIVSPEANPISPEHESRRAGIEHLKACVDSCGELGADALVGPLYSPCGLLVGRPRTEDEWKWGLEALREVGEYAKNSAIKLAVEPLNRFETYFLNSSKDAVKLVTEVGLPNFGMMLDTFHINIEEKHLCSAIKLAGDKLIHFHISENDRGTPGDGHIAWDEVFFALRSINYDGWLVVEAFSRALPEVAGATCIWRDMIPSEEYVAEKSGKFIREHWAKAG